MSIPEGSPWKGQTGETVAENFELLRGSKSYEELAAATQWTSFRLQEASLRRVKSGRRRVDVDDLVVFARMLNVSPITLLMPQAIHSTDTFQPWSDKKVSAGQYWNWLRADEPLDKQEINEPNFQFKAQPKFAFFGKG